jgi:hypothetical protein
MKVTVCGSMIFYPEMQEAQRLLEAAGHEVRIPLLDNELPPELGGGSTLVRPETHWTVTVSPDAIVITGG